MISMSESQERRNGPRQRVLKAGVVQFYHSPVTIDCMIRNLTERGAKLTFAAPVPINLVFRLVHADGRVQNCRAIWVEKNEVGVEFINEPLAA
jgi:hypothetical protein